MARKVAKKSKSTKAKKATRKVKAATPRGMARRSTTGNQYPGLPI